MNIIELAREVGFEVHDRKQQARVGMDALLGIDSTQKLERFAQLVREEALEEAAKVCEEPYEFTSQEASLLATAIRQLKGKQ